VGTSYQPEFEFYRKEITKVNALITSIDDVYGTLEELQFFREAIDR